LRLGAEILKKVIIYVHGKGGSASEIERFKEICPNYDFVGVAYQEYLPWIVEKQITDVYDQVSSQYDQVLILANSIGAYFTMLTKKMNIKKAFFISPLLNMEQYLEDLLAKNSVTESELEQQKVVSINGEEITWKSLQYVRKNPVVWKVPTEILYGEHDDHTSMETLDSFTKSHNAHITIMQGGQHRFHTREQLAFLNNWLKKSLS